MDNLFDVCLCFVCKYFIEHFGAYVHERYWPMVFFFVVVVVSSLVWVFSDRILEVFWK